MKQPLLSVVLGLASLGFASFGQAAPVEYVKVCSIYGAGFHYIPGTDICRNEWTGDSRQQTEGGTWRSLLPYPEGKWATIPQLECGLGRLVTLGTYTSTDFTPNVWNRKQTQPFVLGLRNGEFVSKVVMGGGFFDPRIPARHGANGNDGLCVRSIDPTVMENFGNGTLNPPFGNGNLPIGCVANSRIVNMPASYVVSATSAYPSVDVFLLGDNTVSGPYTYGSRLVVTTDIGSGNGVTLTYFDAATQTTKPMAGRTTVSVCVEQGATSPGGR